MFQTPINLSNCQSQYNASQCPGLTPFTRRTIESVSWTERCRGEDVKKWVGRAEATLATVKAAANGEYGLGEDSDPE